MTPLISAAIRAIESRVVIAGDNRATRNRKVFNVLASLAFGALFAGLIGPTHLSYGVTTAGWIYVALGAVLLANLGVFYLVHKNNTWFVAVIVTSSGTGVLAASLSMGGLASSAGGYFWIIVLTVALVTSGFKPRTQFTGSTLLLLGVVVLAIAEPHLEQIPLPAAVSRALTAGVLLANVTYVFAVLYYTVGQNRLAFGLLREERAKSESLLLNILPKDVAASLKENPRAVADHFEDASVLFADLVGFTPMTEGMTPAELVELLNEVFTTFDGLVERHGLEKIKTIGDCYMVASGVPRPRPDHAVALVRMALEMRELLAARRFAGRHLAFRIGIDSGPVVAGVIGSKKFAYDLWGDAVNTASRMESHGQTGQVQITRSTYERVREHFTCEPRGEIDVKGKGSMPVWHVLAAG